MSQADLKSLLAESVSPSSIQSDGRYTSPKTWGVYEVERLLEGKRGKCFHFGNHPIRQQELARQFGKAELVGLYLARSHAEKIARFLNNPRRK